jgi:ADP-ribosylglycohydrolase
LSVDSDEDVEVLGAIAGDVIGSVFEGQSTKSTDFPLFSHFSRFTDDTVLTAAVADALMLRHSGQGRIQDARAARRLYTQKLRAYGRRYRNAGYGQLFAKWLDSESTRGYRSYGNGSAMRVSPVGFAFDDLADVLREAKLSAAVTHNHREGIKGAQVIASAVYLARTGSDKEAIRAFIEDRFGYSLRQRLDQIRPNYKFDSSCQGSVPYAIIAFLESRDFEDAIRKAISLGGDSDTLASMAGAIAHAFYGAVPSGIVGRVRLILDASLRRVVDEFTERYMS